ncbi:MAG TPA: BON domain-containing protein [Anaerolineales bacterium]|nr:BON domain-containing protein [Anaerolineales bacterium]
MNDTMHGIGHQVQNTIMQDRSLQDYDIEVLDNNGIITLRGVVPTRDAREKAEAIAREIEGVTSVINELDVI